MTAKTPLQILMSQLGFGSGFRLPVANEENQRFEKLLEEKQRHLLDIRGQAEDERKGFEDLRQHMTRVTTEISLQKKIIQTKKTALTADEESEAKRLANFNNLQHDLSKTRQRCDELKTKNYSNIQQLEKRKIWLETTKAKKTQYKLILDDLKEAIQNKEKDMDYILDLMNIDDKTVREFEHKYNKMGEELIIAKNELAKLAQVTQSLVVQYEREVSHFRQVHKERNQAVDVWQNMIDSLKNRDVAIKEIAEKYRVICSKTRKVENELEKKRVLGDFGKSDSHEAEFRITCVDRRMAEIRSYIGEENELVKLLKTDIASMQNTTRNLSSSLKLTIEKIQTVDKEIETMESRTLEAANAIKSMKQHLNETSEEGAMKLKSLEDLIDAEESKMNELRKKLDAMRKFRRERQAQALIVKEELYRTELKVKDMENIVKRLRRQVKTEELNVGKAKKAYFDIELKASSLERRIQEIEQPPEFNDLLIETLERAKEELEECHKDNQFLLNQKSHMESCNWRIQKEVNEIVLVKKNLLATVEDNAIINKILLKELEVSKKAVTETEIEYSLVKLTHRRLANMAAEQRETHFTLEQFRLYICTSIQQRKSEIEAHLSLLKANIRITRDEKSKLASDRNQLLAEINKKKNIYETLTATMASGEERAKTEFTEAYIIIKHAQEKESVKKEGDIWDKRVQEAEKETMALQNTLAVMKSANSAFKESLAPILVGTQDYEHIKMLEHKLLEGNIRKRKVDKTLKELCKEYTKRESELEDVNRKIGQMKGTLSDKHYQLNAIGFEIKKQKDKIERANKAAFRTQKSFKNQPPAEKIIVEAELKLIFTQDKFSYALKMLDRAIQSHPEFRAPVLEFLHQKPGLQNIAKHLEKSGKCISAEASLPSTPQRKPKTPVELPPRPSIQDTAEAEMIRAKHRYLKHIPSVFERRETNVEKQERLEGKVRRLLHEEIVDKLDNEKSTRLKTISSRKSMPNISEIVAKDKKVLSRATSASSGLSHGAKKSGKNGALDERLQDTRKASY